jgi:hypothetical protein
MASSLHWELRRFFSPTATRWQPRKLFAELTRRTPASQTQTDFPTLTTRSRIAQAVLTSHSAALQVVGGQQAGHELQDHDERFGAFGADQKDGGQRLGRRTGAFDGDRHGDAVLLQSRDLQAILGAALRGLAGKQFQPVLADVVGHGDAMFGSDGEAADGIGGEVDDQLRAGEPRDESDGVAQHLLDVVAGLDDARDVPVKLPQVERLRQGTLFPLGNDREVARIGGVGDCFHGHGRLIRGSHTSSRGSCAAWEGVAAEVGESPPPPWMACCAIAEFNTAARRCAACHGTAKRQLIGSAPHSPASQAVNPADDSISRQPSLMVNRKWLAYTGGSGSTTVRGTLDMVR